jgi:preprotein translocase subunit Sec61beta
MLCPDHAVTAAYKIGIMLLAANISLPALIWAVS